MDAREFFLLEHARAHSAAVAPDGGPLWLEDSVLGGLDEDQLRRRHAGGNSLAWLLWHMTRIEDVAVNVLLAAQPQVLEEGEWPGRLGIERRDVGSGMADDEVASFSDRVDVPTLRAYRAAVGRQTREVVAGLGTDGWHEPVTAADVERATAAGVFGERADWLKGFWLGRPRAWLLSWTAAGHCVLHFGEAMALRGRAGMGGGR